MTHTTRVHAAMSLAAAICGMLIPSLPATAQCDGWSWFPNQWSLLPGSSTIRPGSLIEFNGDLIAVDRHSLGSVSYLNGEVWSHTNMIVGTGPNKALVHEDELYVAGGYSVVRTVDGSIFEWDQLVQFWGQDKANTAIVFNGDYIVGGNFTSIEGVEANNIARWDGQQWNPIGSGLDGGVFALIEYEGDLIAGGVFETAGGQPAKFIARWDGQSWSQMGAGFGHSAPHANYPPGVYSLGIFENSIFPNKTLIAGGRFTHSGSVTTNCVARWNGSAWEAMMDGLCNPSDSGRVVHAFTNFNGDLYAAGGILKGPVRAVARWSDQDHQWHPVSPNLSGTPYVLKQRGHALLVAGSMSLQPEMELKGVVAWNTSVPSLTEQPEHAFASPGSDAVFTLAVGQAGTPTWQIEWHRDGVPLAHANNGNAFGYDTDTLTLTNVSEADLGVYQALVFNPCGYHISTPVSLYLTGGTPSTCSGDLTGSGSVGMADLLQLLTNWGPCP